MVGRSPSWVPILAGAAAAQARRIVCEITKQIDDHPPLSSPSLSSGNCGLALFHGYLSLQVKEPIEREARRQRAGEALDLAITSLENTPGRPWGLFGGVAGIAWTVDRLVQWGVVETELEQDPNEEIDKGLAGFLDTGPEFWRGNTELIRGLAGVGVYLLGRMGSNPGNGMLERVVGHLDALAIWDDAGCAWFDPPETLHPKQRAETPTGCYNLGLSHGLPGVMLFLARAARAGIPGADHLASGASRWLLRQKAQNPDGSQFLATKRAEPQLHRRSRVAWCYGDLGVSIALMGAAAELGDAALAAEAIQVAKAILPRDRATWMLQDFGLCHGTAGNAHLFNRLYQATGDMEFRDMAEELFEEVIRGWDPEKDGYRIFRAQGVAPGKACHMEFEPTSLLEGSNGIALALLSAAGPVEPLWDGYLMADLRSICKEAEIR